MKTSRALDFLTGLVLAEAQVKKLVVPVFGLLLAACTYQFAPTATEDSRLIDAATSSGEQVAGGFDLTPPDTDVGFSPGAPGGGDIGGGPSAPDPGNDGSGGGGMPDMPGGGSMPGGG